MFSIARRIRASKQGLLAMHPFVDVLEGRNLFTATAHDGVLDITAVINAAAGEQTASPWSTHAIGTPLTEVAADGELAAQPTEELPARIVLDAGTSGSVFADKTITDSPLTLFGSALHDRRGRLGAAPLPTAAQIAQAQSDREAGESTPTFYSGRSLTGTMAPYVTMRAHEVEHVFATEGQSV